MKLEWEKTNAGIIFENIRIKNNPIRGLQFGAAKEDRLVVVVVNVH